MKRRADNRLDFEWRRIVQLAPGERTGNQRGVVSHRGEYMLLETKEGSKRTSCLDAARYMAGKYSFDQVAAICSDVEADELI